jgi:hypothetical protein
MDNYLKKYLKYKKKYIQLKGGSLYLLPWAIKCINKDYCDTLPDKNENIKNNIIEFIISNLIMAELNKDIELKLLLKDWLKNTLDAFIKDYDKTLEMIAETIFVNDNSFSGFIKLEDLQELINNVYINDVNNIYKYNIRELFYLAERINIYNYGAGRKMSYNWEPYWEYGIDTSNKFFSEIQRKTRRQSELLINKKVSCRTNLTKKILKLVKNPLSIREEKGQYEETLFWCPGDNFWIADIDERVSNIGGLSGLTYVFTTLVKTFTDRNVDKINKLNFAIINWLVSISAHSYFECIVILPPEKRRIIINDMYRYLNLIDLNKNHYIFENLIKEYNKDYIFNYFRELFNISTNYPEIIDL